MENVNKNYPKVLVISSAPFSKTKNNGKTLTSFFAGYNVESIAQFCFSGDDCNAEVCDKYYFLTNEDAIHKRGGKAYAASDIKIADFGASQMKGVRRFFNFFSQMRMPLTTYIKNRIWEKADYSNAHKWIEAFHPDVVFFQGFSMTYGYDFALEVCKRNHIPMILELTDDYTHNLYPLSILNYYNLKRYKKRFSEAIRYSYKTIVISDAMKEEYEPLYGGDMVVMMNTVKKVSENSIPRTTGDYVYAGNVLLNRWKVLRSFGVALAQTVPGAVLNIYTPDMPPKAALKAFSKVPSIRYGGSLTKEELENRLQQCEYVVHVEAFDRKNRWITRLSMSTKISEYLACGANVVAIGPSDVASMKCLDENRLALCINHYSIKRIADALEQIDSQSIHYKRNAEAFLEDCASNANKDRIAGFVRDATAMYGRK